MFRCESNGIQEVDLLPPRLEAARIRHGSAAPEQLRDFMARKPDKMLRRGWTTGACATAATKAAYTALLTGTFPDPVSITLPKGEQPDFALTHESLRDGEASSRHCQRRGRRSGCNAPRHHRLHGTARRSRQRGRFQGGRGCRYGNPSRVTDPAGESLQSTQCRAN